VSEIWRQNRTDYFGSTELSHLLVLREAGTPVIQAHTAASYDRLGKNDSCISFASPINGNPRLTSKLKHK
jgi:hypothetical protein